MSAESVGNSVEKVPEGNNMLLIMSTMALAGVGLHSLNRGLNTSVLLSNSVELKKLGDVYGDGNVQVLFHPGRNLGENAIEQLQTRGIGVYGIDYPAQTTSRERLGASLRSLGIDRSKQLTLRERIAAIQNSFKAKEFVQIPHHWFWHLSNSATPIEAINPLDDRNVGSRVFVNADEWLHFKTGDELLRQLPEGCEVIIEIAPDKQTPADFLNFIDKKIKTFSRLKFFMEFDLGQMAMSGYRHPNNQIPNPIQILAKYLEDVRLRKMIGVVTLNPYEEGSLDTHGPLTETHQTNFREALGLLGTSVRSYPDEVRGHVLLEPHPFQWREWLDKEFHWTLLRAYEGKT